MIKNCVKLCYGLTVVKNNDQKLRQAMLWVLNVEKQWSKIASCYIIGSQCWKRMTKNCAKLGYGLAMLRKNDQKLRQAMLWVDKVEKKGPKIASSYVMGWQCWQTLIKNCVKLCYGFPVLKNNDQKFRQAMLWVSNVEKQW